MCRAILALALVLLFEGAAMAAPTTVAEVARALPTVDALVSELEGQEVADLERYHGAILTRLLLDQGRVAAEGAHALHDVLVLAALELVLAPSDDGRPEAAFRVAQASYTLHAIGHAFETRPRLGLELAELVGRARSPEDKALFKQLQVSAKGLHALGRRWFPEALQRALRSSDRTQELHVMRGLWLEREGRLSQAIEALTQAVEARATVASTIDLVRVLARSGNAKASGALARRLAAKAPGAEGTLAAVIMAAADERATAHFTKHAGEKSVAERVKQAQRYARQGQVAQAEGLIHALVSDHLHEPEVFSAAAGLYVRWRRLGRLVQLLEAAEALPSPPARLPEARVAAVVAAHLAGVGGATAHALISRRVEDDLAALRASPTPEVRRFARHSQLILAATQGDRTALEEASRRAVRADASAATLEVVAAAWLSQGEMARAMSELERGLSRLAPAKRGSLALTLASLELALGAGKGDRQLVRQGVARLDALELDAVQLSAQRTYLQAIGGRMSAWLGSAVPTAGGPGASDEAALRALLPLVDLVDKTEPRGAVLITGATLSAGALGLALGAHDLALGAFQIARRLDLSPFMEGLVVGQVALSADDVQGGLAALDRALESAATATERFLAHKWRALAANRAGDLQSARAHFEGMLSVWSAARAPKKKARREPVSLLLGGVEIAALMPAEGEAQIRALITAIPAFAADFPHDRASIKALLAKAKGAQGGRSKARRGSEGARKEGRR